MAWFHDNHGFRVKKQNKDSSKNDKIQMSIAKHRNHDISNSKTAAW